MYIGRYISVDNKFFCCTYELFVCANDVRNPLNYFVNVFAGLEMSAELCQNISSHIS